MLVGRSGAGKTTLTQAMKGKKITYHKTQYINNYDVIIDTPGEYAENKTLARALVIYSYEADVVGLLMSAVEDYSLYSPNIVSLATRDVIGIVTQIDREDAGMKEQWFNKSLDESINLPGRSEERRVGKECRSRWSPYH